MFTLQHNRITQIRAAVLILFLAFVAGLFFYPRMISKTFGSESEQPEATPTPRKRTTAQTRKPKYSEFPHDIQAHKKDCNSCHKFPSPNWKQVRKVDAAFPDITDYPRHESCLNCHRQQFFKGNPPQICTICHTNPGPRNSNRHPFPNPREIFDLSKKGQTAVSDFEIYFPHDTHIDIVSENKIEKTREEVQFVKAGLNLRKAQTESCSVCHQTLNPQGDSEDEYFTKPPEKLGDAFWLKKGTFKTVPTSHEKCFQCHSQEAGMLPAPNSCNVCHKLKQPEGKTDFDAKFASLMSVNDKITLTAWRKRDSSATFRHEWFSHNELACTTCHNVTAMNTTVPQTKKVKVLSCGGDGTGCHITPTLDDGGALNFEVDARKSNPNFQCVKCHISYGKSPIPESHVKAISTLAGK